MQGTYTPTPFKSQSPLVSAMECLASLGFGEAATIEKVIGKNVTRVAIWPRQCRLGSWGTWDKHLSVGNPTHLNGTFWCMAHIYPVFYFAPPYCCCCCCSCRIWFQQICNCHFALPFLCPESDGPTFVQKR